MELSPAASRLRWWILIVALILLAPAVRAAAQSGGNTLYLPVVGKSQVQPVTAVLKWAYGGCYSSWCETGWYSSPAVLDIDGDGRDEIIASAYSLRPLPGAPVSTPVTWAELADLRDPREFTLFTVPDRLADGDPWAGIDAETFGIEPLLRLWEDLPGGELNFPPDYPKMPGEPPRVQPSKKNAANWEDDGVTPRER